MKCCDDYWNPSGPVFGDIGQPDLVGGLGAELTLHEVVMHRWSGSAVQSTFRGEDRPDAFLGTQSCDTVLAGGDPAPRELVGVDVAGGVDQVRVIPIPLR